MPPAAKSSVEIGVVLGVTLGVTLALGLGVITYKIRSKKLRVG